MSSVIVDARELSERLADSLPLVRCTCGEIQTPRGHCLNIGDCAIADRQASRQSNRRGAAASARPAAWTVSGGVD